MLHNSSKQSDSQGLRHPTQQETAMPRISNIMSRLAPKTHKNWCSICDMELKTPIHAEKHYLSAKHTRKVYQLRDRGSLSPNLEEQKSYCKICCMFVDGDLLTNGHLDRMKHKKNKAMYCELCEVKTVSSEALAEHEKLSLTHLKKVKDMELHSLNDDKVCNKVVAKKADSPSPITSQCYLCDLKFDCPQLYDKHLSGFLHVSIEFLKTKYFKSYKSYFEVTELGKAILCKMCNVKLLNKNDVMAHFEGTKHVKKMDALFGPMITIADLIDHKLEEPQRVGEKLCDSAHIQIKETVSNICQVDAPEPIATNLAEVEVPQESPATHSFYCYLCKIPFNNKIELNVHAIKFPHSEMAKWKSEVVCMGVNYAEYWIVSQSCLNCSICDLDLLTSNIAKSHAMLPKHKANLAEWCEKFAAWKLGNVVDPKYFYCRSCDLRLSGTSEAEKHYSTNLHQERLEFYCKTCEVANSSEKMLGTHQQSVQHKNNPSSCEDVNSALSTDENNQMISEPTLTSNIDYEAKENESKRVAYLQQHANDFAQTLCRSKTIPFKVAMEYLKKIQAEVLELAKKYEPKENEQV